MKFVVLALLFWIFCAPSYLSAQLRSPKAVHPVAFMHQVPTGSTPGWFGTYWFDLEISQANIWNVPMTVRNLASGKTFTYSADFEQTTYSLVNGFQLNEDLAFTVDLPYVVRNGGFLDQTIENVHIGIGSQRFLREDYERNGSRFRLTENGQTVLDEGASAGVSSIVLGLKYWPLKWVNKGCPCGLGFGLQATAPVESAPKGYYSGGVNTTASIHLGAPLGEDGGLWATAAFSYVPENKYFENWPRKKYLQMYEGTLDIPLGGGVGIFASVRFESPLMERDQLEFIDTYATRYDYLVNRMSSGYNSLVYWRVYETFGLRFRIGEDTMLRLSVLEDGAFGDYDETGGGLYVNNAPDVMGVLQLKFGF